MQSLLNNFVQPSFHTGMAVNANCGVYTYGSFRCFIPFALR